MTQLFAEWGVTQNDALVAVAFCLVAMFAVESAYQWRVWRRGRPGPNERRK